MDQLFAKNIWSSNNFDLCRLQLQPRLSRETERRQEQDRTLQVLQLAEREGPQRRSRWGNQRQTEPVSSREDDSMQEPPNARVLNAHEASLLPKVKL